MTRDDRKSSIQKTQSQIITTYNKVFDEESRPYIKLDGTLSLKEATRDLQ